MRNHYTKPSLRQKNTVPLHPSLGEIHHLAEPIISNKITKTTSPEFQIYVFLNFLDCCYAHKSIDHHGPWPVKIVPES